LRFSASLVQTLVQTAGGVAVSPLLVSLTIPVPVLDKLGVTGSSPVSPTLRRPLSTPDSGRFALAGQLLDVPVEQLCQRVLDRGNDHRHEEAQNDVTLLGGKWGQGALS